MAAMPEDLLPIGAVERETGLSKDVLRKWEVRYGFPRPERDPQGERRYPQEQVERLRLIKRLLDTGMRPARLVPESTGDLRVLAEGRCLGPREEPNPELAASLFAHLRANDPEGLRQLLQRRQLEQGLGSFVLDTIAPMIRLVGEAWARGELQIFEEHIFTEVVQGVLRAPVTSLALGSQGRPRVLLTTPPNEPHALGILMVATLFTLEGAKCISLGPQIPLAEISNAAAAHEADVVALSFSSGFPARQVDTSLKQLRTCLDPAIELWAGGAGTANLRRPPAGVQAITSLTKAMEAPAAWRASHTERDGGWGR